MEIRTGLSIYNQPWLIEPSAGLRLLDFWEENRQHMTGVDFRRGEKMQEADTLSPYALSQKFFARESVVMAPDNRYDMRDFKGFDGHGVAVIPIEGALMKGDMCGYFGTESLRNVFLLASNTDSIHTIILSIDSPGGMVNGTEAFASAIHASNKRTVALVSGMAASAAYWLASSCDEVYASNGTDIVGSIGTMISWRNRDKYDEASGIVLREYYATASTQKNASYRQADKGDGRALIAETLDPLNDVFLAAVKSNRGDRLKDQANTLSGRTYVTADALAVGLIDGVKTMDEVIQSSPNSKPKNKSRMTAFEKTIAATKTDGFAVVDGGFLATEDQLKNLEAHIAQQETLLAAAANQITGLSAKLQELETAATEAEVLKTSAQEATTKLAASEKALADAQAKVAGMEKGFGFKQTGVAADPKPAHEDDPMAALANLAHNRTADALL